MPASPSPHPAQRINTKNTWLYRWIYPIVTGFMFAAVFLRAVLIFQGSPLLGKIIVLLLTFPVIFLGNALLKRRYPWASVLLVGLEMLVTLSLILITSSVHSDFFAFLFVMVGMQVMQQSTPKLTAIVVGLAALLIFFSLLPPVGGFQALALTIVYTCDSIFLVAYIGSVRRMVNIQEQQQSLAEELIEANRKLEHSSQTAQYLATNRERQRLARELHDSVTQTIFSMTLASKSALLLMDRDRQQVGVQLDRLDSLAQSALSEMQVLISHLSPGVQSGRFQDTLQMHLTERERRDGLSVRLEVSGNGPLTSTEEASLFRIAQEALNNVVKHGQTTTAVLRLHLTEPLWMEVEDHGAGFDPQQAKGGGRVGLAGMRERAAEIGWTFEVASSLGQGTRVRVQKGTQKV
jgi:signal transduction histidine kinase